MKSKKIRRILYVAVPVLWCGALYLGSENSLGTVLAKSVTTVTQTMTAYSTIGITETEVSTQTLDGRMTVTEAETGTLGSTQLTVVKTVNATETATWLYKELSEPGAPSDQAKSTVIKKTLVETTEYEFKDTETENFTKTFAETGTADMVLTKTLQPTAGLTQSLTLTETLTVTDDGQEDNKEIEQVTPSTIPTAAPTETPTAAPTETPTAVPTIIPTATPTVTPTIIPTATPTITPTITPTATPTITPMTAPAETPTVAPAYDGDSEEPQGWRPQTADEKERASYVQKGKVKLHKPSSVTIEPAMQGPLCIAAMKNAMMKGGQIGYTYNIKYIADENAKQPVYEIDKPIQITFSVPKDILKEGRTYEMICVSKDGTTYTCPAAVDEDGNLTFTTKYFYAFALVYKDV